MSNCLLEINCLVFLQPICQNIDFLKACYQKRSNFRWFFLKSLSHPLMCWKNRTKHVSKQSGFCGEKKSALWLLTTEIKYLRSAMQYKTSQKSKVIVRGRFNNAKNTHIKNIGPHYFWSRNFNSYYYPGCHVMILWPFILAPKA